MVSSYLMHVTTHHIEMRLFHSIPSHACCAAAPLHPVSINKRPSLTAPLILHTEQTIQ